MKSSLRLRELPDENLAITEARVAPDVPTQVKRQSSLGFARKRGIVSYVAVVAVSTAGWLYLMATTLRALVRGL
jgi:hypothetical protein